MALKTGGTAKILFRHSSVCQPENEGCPIIVHISGLWQGIPTIEYSFHPIDLCFEIDEMGSAAQVMLNPIQ
ncbi:MAG: hypothetical protein GY749_22185 [Desulfobacteraceae bacterium]|nr:hypothetical protein [Desulfobacteraceae bacterium]